MRRQWNRGGRGHTTGQEVTAMVADNFTKSSTSVCAMSKVAGVDLFPVDIGMAVDVPSVTVKEEKVAYGTRNFFKRTCNDKRRGMAGN